MKKEVIGDIIRSLILFVLFLPLFYWIEYIKPISVAVPFIAFCFFIVNMGLIWFFNERKFKVNNPYKASKKNKLGRSILLGLVAGLHYLFFIGTYNHKKYNTQVWYPETLECFFGNISEAIILDLYIITGTLIFGVIGFYYIIFLSIPLITNAISLIIKRKG